MTPVPRLVHHPVRIVLRKTQVKAIVMRMLLQPAERGCIGEAYFGWAGAGCAQVDGSTTVMLTIAGRHINAENVSGALAARALAGPDVGLVLDTAKSRDYVELNGLFQSSPLHREPADAGVELQPDRAADVVAAGVMQVCGLENSLQLVLGWVVGRNFELRAPKSDPIAMLVVKRRGRRWIGGEADERSELLREVGASSCVRSRKEPGDVGAAATGRRSDFE